MDTIIIGTTPTIKYSFRAVDVENLKTAILTVKRNGDILLRKELEDAEVGEKSVEWHLSQEDTLAIGTGSARIMMNWMLRDGTRGATSQRNVMMDPNHIPEVIV